MHSTAKKYLVDALLFVDICAVAFVGALLAFVIPRGPTTPPGDKLFFGLSRYQWVNIHSVFSLVLAALVIIHIALSWKWVTEVSKRLFGDRWKKTLVAVSLAWIAVLFAAWLVSL